MEMSHLNDRKIYIFITEFIEENLALFYIFLPLLLTILGYFHEVNRSPLIAIGYFIISIAIVFMRQSIYLYLTNSLICMFFIAYTLIIMVSISTLSDNKLQSIWFLFTYSILPFLIGIGFTKKINWRSILVSFLFLTVVFIFVSIENISRGIDQRAYVFGNQANSIPLSLVCAFIFSFIFSFFQNKNFFFISLILIFTQGSFSGFILPRWFFLATFLILFTSVYFRRKNHIGSALISIFIVGWSFSIFILENKANFYTSNLIPRDSIIDSKSSIALTSIELRIKYIFTGINLFLDSPFFGIGAGNFGIASGGSINSFPHLSMLHIMSEMGIFVLVLYISLLGYGAITLIYAVKINPIHFPWLTIFLYGFIFSIFHGNYLTDKLIFMALGYASSLGNVFRKT